MKNKRKSAGLRTAPPPCSPVPVGWQCPRCGKGLAPWMPECNCHITIVVNPPAQPYHTTGTGDPSPQVAGSAPVVCTDPVLEAIARKLHGIAGVPPGEQAAMIRRAAKAGRGHDGTHA